MVTLLGLDHTRFHSLWNECIRALHREEATGAPLGVEYSLISVPLILSSGRL